MNFNCSDSLTAKPAQYVRDMQDGRLTYHYVTSACEYDVHQAIGASGGWQFIHYHKALSDSIETKLSCKIGQEHGFNSSGKPLIVGVCAEQHAASDLLAEASPDESQPFDVANIVFSPAIRLKGKQMRMEEMNPCVNCETIFT